MHIQVRSPIAGARLCQIHFLLVRRPCWLSLFTLLNTVLAVNCYKTVELSPSPPKKKPLPHFCVLHSAGMNNTHATPPIYMYIVFFKSFPKVKRETYIKPIKDLCPLTTSMNRSSGTMTQKACCKHVIVHLGTVGKSKTEALVLCHAENNGRDWEYSQNQHFPGRVVICRGHSCIFSKVAVLNYCHAFLFYNSPQELHLELFLNIHIIWQWKFPLMQKS